MDGSGLKEKTSNKKFIAGLQKFKQWTKINRHMQVENKDTGTGTVSNFKIEQDRKHRTQRQNETTEKVF